MAWQLTWLGVFGTAILLIQGRMVQAQENFSHDSAYVAQHSRSNNATLYLGRFGRSLQLSTRSDESKPSSVGFSPNASAFIGASLQYRKLFLLVEAAIPGTHKVNPATHGIRGLGLFLSHFNSRWGITAFASHNRGLLTRPTMQMPMYGLRSDMRLTTIGFHYYRFFNAKRFSYPAAAAAMAKSKRSSGSWAVLVTPSARWWASGNGLVSGMDASRHFKGYQAPVEQLNLFGLQVKPGYIHHFLIGRKGLFVSPMLFTGAGADVHHIHTNTMRSNGINLNLGYRAKIVAGFNGDKWFATVDALTDLTQSILHQSRLTNRYSEWSINAGIRF